MSHRIPKVYSGRSPEVAGRWAGATDVERAVLLAEAHAEALRENGAPDPREVDVVFSFPADGIGRSMPVRDEAGRIRVCEKRGKRVGWAVLTDIEWTDELP